MEEEHNAQLKVNLQIRSKIDSFTRANERAFDKLKEEREQTKKRIEQFLDSRVECLRKKSKLSRDLVTLYKPASRGLNDYEEQLSRIKADIENFF